MGLFGKGGKGKPDAQQAQEIQENTGVEAKKAKGSFFKAKPKKDKDKGKKAKKEKEKKSLFGGKKKDVTLLEMMQLEESVAAASLDVVQELADIGGSAVREVESGLLIVALTNQMLEDAGLDATSEEFGSFAEGLRSETIESIALAEDLATGVVGIIPSNETIAALDEYDFIHNTPLRWAVVPFDLSDEDRLMVLDSEVHLDRLVELANDDSLELTIENGEVVELGEDSYSEQDEYEDDEYVESADDEYDDDTDGVEDDSFDDEDTYDEPADSAWDDEPEFGAADDFDEDLLDDEPSFDEDTELELDDDFGISDDFSTDDDDELVDMEDELMSPEETKEVINRLATHGFNNTELDLDVDMRIFDDYFDSLSIARFETARQDNSELQNVVSKLRQDANAELQRFHQEHIQTLRNKFTTSMRDTHNRLVEALDHKNEQTTYGSRVYEIETTYDDSLDDLDRMVAQETDRIVADYNREREEFAENAKREALAVFDSRYKDGRDRKVSAVRDQLQVDLKSQRDTDLGDLYADRRTVAKRLFDKATTTLLQKLQEEYMDITQRELAMYDAFRKDMDIYLRKHFADEVLRSKAEAEKLRQSHEAERVRSEYEQLLATRAAQLNEADDRARTSLRQLESTHKEQLDHMRADFERRIEREQRDNVELREMLQESNRNNGKIGDQKEKEIEHRLKLYEDQIQAKNKELEYANQRANQSQKPLKFIIAAVATIGIAIGVISGFVFGAGQSQPITYQTQQPQQQQTVESQTVGQADLQAPQTEGHRESGSIAASGVIITLPLEIAIPN